MADRAGMFAAFSEAWDPIYNRHHDKTPPAPESLDQFFAQHWIAGPDLDLPNLSGQDLLDHWASLDSLGAPGMDAFAAKDLKALPLPIAELFARWR